MIAEETDWLSQEELTQQNWEKHLGIHVAYGGGYSREEYNWLFHMCWHGYDCNRYTGGKPNYDWGVCHEHVLVDDITIEHLMRAREHNASLPPDAHPMEYHRVGDRTMAGVYMWISAHWTRVDDPHDVDNWQFIEDVNDYLDMKDKEYADFLGEWLIAYNLWNRV